MDLNDILAKAGDHLVVSRAFGTPIEKDGAMIVPVAIVAGGGGGGQGTDEKANQGEGGGFGGLVYPIGVYSIREGQVRFVPAINVTRIIGALLFMVRVVAKSQMKVTVVHRRAHSSPAGRRSSRPVEGSTRGPGPRRLGGLDQSDDIGRLRGRQLGRPHSWR